MTRRIKSFVQSVVNCAGYRLVRTGNNSAVAKEWTDNLDTFFILLRRFGFSPRHILDVGANRGAWTRRAIKFFPFARYTLVEPQDTLKDYIADLKRGDAKITWINAGVGDKAGTLPFAVGEPDSTSTFYNDGNPNTPRILVPVVTLNELAASQGVPEIVKIDAEGYDLRVLAGASALLGKTEVMLVEVTIFAPAYENTIAKVVRFMDEAGYKVADITDINRSPKHGVLWLCELAFVRVGNRLFDAANDYD